MQNTNSGQLQQLIAGLPQGIILFDSQGAIVSANQAALRMHDIEDIAELGATKTGYLRRFAFRYKNDHDYRDQPKITAIAPAPHFAPGRNVSNTAVVEVRRRADPQWKHTHRIRFMSLTHQTHGNGCLALVIEDITEESSAAERFEQTFNSDLSAALICRLSDLRYVRANSGFTHLTGYAEAEIIEHSMHDIDIFAGVKRKAMVLKCLGEGRAVPRMDTVLPLTANRGCRHASVAGQPINYGREACMLFTFTELESRRKMERAVRQSEDRFASLLRISTVPTLLLAGVDLRVVDTNEAFLARFGYAPDDVLGHSASGLGVLGQAATCSQFERALASRESMSDCELVAEAKDGSVIQCCGNAEPVTAKDKACLLVTLTDISVRKRSEAELFDAVQAVMHDTAWFSQAIVEKVANTRASKCGQASSAHLADLTRRETEVLGLVCQGLADKQIASHLHVSPHTVRNHVATIYWKLGVHKRGAVIIWARERGFTGTDANTASTQIRSNMVHKTLCEEEMAT